MTSLYFAYGSNLSARGWGDWRRRMNLPRLLLRAVGPAWLPDRELAFDYYSRGRGGGALDVVMRRGQATPGYLFEMAEGAREALDRKEGAPRFYRPLETTALRPGGRAARVLTYEVCPERRQDFTPPTPAYLAEVREGYRKRGLQRTWMLDAAARGEPAAPMARHLFVYGTLKRGGLRWPLLEALGARDVHAARAPGRLLDLGAYPGAVFSEDGGGVRGELVALADPARALQQIDRVEGFQGWEAAGSLFQRVLLEMPDARGKGVLAWSYQISAAHREAPALPDGVWRGR